MAATEIPPHGNDGLDRTLDREKRAPDTLLPPATHGREKSSSY
jgi:hypothetical protein